MANDKDKERERRERERRERERREAQIEERPNGTVPPLTHEQIEKLKRKA